MWVVDLGGDAVIAFSGPDQSSPQGYREAQTVGRGETLAVAAIAGLWVSIDDLLRPSEW